MRRARTLLVSLSVLALLGPVSVLPTARAAFPGDNGLIAFVRNVSGNSEIYTMKADGSNQTNITNDGAVDDMPVWSPDGKKIAFTSNRAGNFEIYVMNANGTGVMRMTTASASYDWKPTWSADGTEIAFERDGPGEQAIYTVPVGGGTPTLLLDGAAEPAYSPDGTRLAYLDMEPDDDSGEIYVLTLATMAKQQITWNTRADTDPEWSPDSTMVAVSRFDSGNGLMNMEVWIVEANGFNEDKLVGPEAMYPGWSPDGTKVAYSGYDGSNWDIFVTSPVPGYPSTRLTTDAGVDADPDWQPMSAPTTGDELIAFTSERDGNPEIYVMAANGADQTRLTSNAAMDDHAAISPDGTQIAFTSWRDGDAEIYLMGIDGSGVTKLTDNGGYDAEPTWSPDGEAVMFVSDRSGSQQLWFTLLDMAITFGPYAAGGTVSNFSPDWSDRGVVYVSDEDGDNDLYTFIPDGTVTTQLTDDPASDYGPDWSPSPPDAIHHHILFVRGAPGEGDIWDHFVEGATETQVTTTPSQWESSPSWRLDSTYFAFARSGLGTLSNAQVWAMDMEGGLHQLTTSAGGNYNPDWGPCTLDADGLCGVVPVPTPVRHARTVTLNLSPNDLLATGKVTCEDGFAACRSDVPVKLQRKTPKGWKLVELVRTNAQGKFKRDLPNVEGTYRAVAKKVRLGADVCLKAISDKVEWSG